MSNNGCNELLFHEVLLYCSFLILVFAFTWTDANISDCTFLSRHRVVNLFLQGYNKTWISTEDHSFEEKLLDDLAISAKVSRIYIRSLNYFSNKNFCL